jgi:hypothetical protein
MIWLLFLSVSPVELTDGRGGGGGDGGAKLLDHEKAWFAINHSIPSGECYIFSGGGDEMVQVCRSFRYISAIKTVKMRIISILKNYYCKGSVLNITGTGSTVCISIYCFIFKVHRFDTSTLLYIFYSQSSFGKNSFLLFYL